MTSINTDTSLELLLETYSSYIENETIVYKSCSGDWIVFLKYESDTNTNETRTNAVDTDYAKYRADKMRVMLIVNKFDATTTDKISNSIYAKRITYSVGEVITEINFDTTLNNTCSFGIHYFKKIDEAFYFELGSDRYKITGLYKEWYENGNLGKKSAYIDGELNGKTTKWRENGDLMSEGNYLDDKRHGAYRSYYENGQIRTNNNYKNGLQHGPQKKWYENGQLFKFANYSEGTLLDYRAWDENGLPIV